MAGTMIYIIFLVVDIRKKDIEFKSCIKDNDGTSLFSQSIKRYDIDYGNVSQNDKWMIAKVSKEKEEAVVKELKKINTKGEMSLIQFGIIANCFYRLLVF